MPSQFVKEFDTPAYKGKVTVNTGVFINNEWRDGSDNTTIEYVCFRLCVVAFSVLTANPTIA